jgi:hypothetical protein
MPFLPMNGLPSGEKLVRDIPGSLVPAAREKKTRYGLRKGG